MCYPDIDLTSDTPPPPPRHLSTLQISVTPTLTSVQKFDLSPTTFVSPPDMSYPLINPTPDFCTPPDICPLQTFAPPSRLLAYGRKIHNSSGLILQCKFLSSQY